MIDLKALRRDPDRFRRGAVLKGDDPAEIDRLLSLDEDHRKALHQVESLRAERKRISKAVGRTSDPEERARLQDQARALREEIDRLEARVRELEGEIRELLLRIPNPPHESVPHGADESENVEVRRWGELPSFEFEPRPHWELGTEGQLIDFERGVKISGSRFYVLTGWGARLERALINFMLDLHIHEHGYVEVFPPVLIRREAMVGTGQLPRFEDDMYLCERDDLFLAPTAEVPVTNLFREEILPPGTLPLYLTAYTACFRREAGAGGRDVRGVIRVHQFNKVEMVKFVEPETSYEELEKLVRDAEEVLQRLRLPYRVVEICTGDLGPIATKKYDLEVWMPGQNRFVEVSSCSNFEDYQARRAGIRYRPEPGAKPRFVHTLNGSGLAVGRTMAAVLENYQLPDGRIRVPEVLRPYMDGVEVIPPEPIRYPG